MALDQKIIENAKDQFNILFQNMLVFEDEDMASYEACYENVFKNGINFSYMSTTFFAQFTGELLIGMYASNPFRKYLIKALDEEKAYNDKLIEYWDESMLENRFGIAGRDYENDTKDLYGMMNASYNKIKSLGEWFGTEDGKKEFEMYCLSRKAVKDIKRIACEYPYLVRRYDHDQTFAKDVMEYAGVIAQQIIQAAGDE